MSAITHVEERYEFVDTVPERGAASRGAIMARAMTVAALYAHAAL